MNDFFQSFRKEISIIMSSNYKIILLFIAPFITFTLIVAIFYKGVLEELPVVVVDNDHSKISRELINKLGDTKTLEIAYKVNDTHQAISLLQSTQAYAAVIIPYNFQRDIYTKRSPQVSVMLNTQYILVGKIIKSTLSSLMGKNPISLQVTPFFNLYQNYFLFLVSALIPAIWQILIVIVMLVSFGEVIKRGEEKEVFAEHMVAKILGKAAPYTLYFTCVGALYLFYIYGTLGWEFQGSFGVTLLGMLCTVIAYQIIALFFLVVGFDYARALSLGAAYTAPAFAFLGVTFPAQSMNDFALFWKSMLPISHYVALQISQANYGADVVMEIPKLLHIMAFWILGIVVYWRFKRRVA